MRVRTHARADVTSSRLRDAIERAADFLLACQFPSGAINDRIANPLAALAVARPSRRLQFRLRGGADIWHTTNALAALACAGRGEARAVRFVCSHLSPAGELSYWGAYPSLCIETCSAAYQVLPKERPRLRATIARHALPGGRWATSMVPAAGGYDAYLAGPSVTAWAVSVLGREHAPLARAGRRYLESTLGQEGDGPADGLWQAHPAFYATPFYPAHLAVRFVSPAAKATVVAATLRRQSQPGGWGFSDQGAPSVLPTALALSTLLHGGTQGVAVRRALARGAAWLLANQESNGRFPLAPAPAALFYAGDVYATCVATTALAGVGDVL